MFACCVFNVCAFDCLCFNNKLLILATKRVYHRRQICLGASLRYVYPQVVARKAQRGQHPKAARRNIYFLSEIGGPRVVVETTGFRQWLQKTDLFALEWNLGPSQVLVGSGSENNMKHDNFEAKKQVVWNTIRKLFNKWYQNDVPQWRLLVHNPSWNQLGPTCPFVLAIWGRC